MSVNDRLGADIKLDEMLVDSDSEDDSSPTDPLADPTGYSCTHCGEEFAAAWSLNVHYRTKHTEKINKCDVCKKTFCTITDLEQHKLIHKVGSKSVGRPRAQLSEPNQNGTQGRRGPRANL